MAINELIQREGLLQANQNELNDIKQRKRFLERDGAVLYTRSLYTLPGKKGGEGKVLFFIGRDREDAAAQSPETVDNGKRLFIVADAASQPAIPEGFRDEDGGAVRPVSASGMAAIEVPFSYDNYLILREVFPFIIPRSLRNERTTIGTGDRLGLATPGHIMAIEPYDAYPVLAQQSIRELNLTNRNYRGVVADAAFHVFQEGFERGYGADGDHLKTIEDIDVALDAEMPMITLDLTEVMKPDFQDYPESRINEAFEGLDSEVKGKVLDLYAGKRFPLQAGGVEPARSGSGGGETRAGDGTGCVAAEAGDGTRRADAAGSEIVLSELEAKRCALMYWEALDFAKKVDDHLRSKRGDQYDLEVSIDETTAPTLPAHHLFIIRELVRRGVTVNSIAPRFIGEFQKGIDYIGDLDEFERQFIIHAAIAKANGGYKISVHSGSDKFSVYPAVGKHTGGKLHLKTAGTSWLEAVKTIASVDPDLYRLIHSKAYDYFGEATKLYHVTTDIDAIKNLDQVADEKLVDFFNDNNARQLIHITYGFLLQDPAVRNRFFGALSKHEDEHYRIVQNHIGSHIERLGIKRIEGS